MLKHYVTIAFRTLLRNRSYALINILGLSVGIACALLIFLIIRFEQSYDTFHDKRERIVRVVSVYNPPEGVHYSAGVPFPTAEALRSDFPQLDGVADIFGTNGQITVTAGGAGGPEKKFNETTGLFYAEPEFFRMFDFPLLAGNPETVLAEPHSAILTRETAERYFGDWKSAMGRTITYRNSTVLKVTGVLENVPPHSDFPLKAVMSFSTFRERNPGGLKDWISVYGDNECFVLLPPGFTADQLDSQLPSFVRRHKPAEYVRDGLRLQPLRELHFDTRFGNFSGGTVSHELITALGLIGLFLLTIACVNFVNLATARAANRAREVGVRKVLGGERRQLALQFLTETAILTLISAVAACAIAEIALPPLNSLLQVSLTLTGRGGIEPALFLLATALVVTLLSGAYPALVLSGFNPLTALKRKATAPMPGGIFLRRGLVVLQFVIAQALIIGMLVAAGQMDLFRSAALGFDKDAVLIVPIPPDSTSRTRIDPLKNRLLQQPGIAGVSMSAFSPADVSNWDSDFKFDRRTTSTSFNAELKWGDRDYFSVYAMQFVAGRPFIQSDTVREFVVNESFLKAFGIRNAGDVLGKEINLWEGTAVAPIVGVVRDFHTRSLRFPLKPVIMGCWKNTYRSINIRVRPGQAQETLGAVERIWNSTYPDNVYEARFLDDSIQAFYKPENQMADLFKVFAGTAVLISCLGLYGLVSFMALQRTKEVGIRKVLGASVASIMVLLSREFALLVGVAFLTAAPIAFFLMNLWLQDFAYRISIGIGILLTAGGLALAVALLTVASQAVRTALANPVEALRYE
jgi:putative ABC transport system permease protein